jgi:hypothetical protein
MYIKQAKNEQYQEKDVERRKEEKRTMIVVQIDRNNKRKRA